MDWLQELYANQPFWVWLGVGALILTAEVATGSGWLLWPAVSAGIVAYLAMLGLDLGLPGEIAAFAVLTVVTTLAGRRFLKSSTGKGDVNNNVERLIGRSGKATSVFDGGYGRVLVDGCEWAAELEDGGALPDGAPVEVARLADGARLVVRPLAALPREPRRVADFSGAESAPEPTP
jgi:membrane protein implicated in regulation of membrane protease activity